MINSDLLSIGNPLWLGMANHLWQSTLFAVAAWLITIFLKKNRARIRYWVWFTVSVKFLIPFSLIVNIGGLIAPDGIKAPAEISPKLNAIQAISQPFKTSELKETPPISDAVKTPSPSTVASSPSVTIPWILFGLWLCGSFLVLLKWYRQNMRVAGIVHKAILLKDGHTVKGFHRIKLENGISHNIRLASTRDMMEPGVFGIFRPVILLPAGILDHFNDSELETILLHECAHIQCRDNLIAFIHMLVEAVFWFHPVVWLTGSKLIAERELACDQSVLRSAKNPRTYAEGILKVCEHYFISPLPSVSGVIGSNLKKRIEVIMKKHIGHELSVTKILFLSLSGFLVLCTPLAIGMVNAPSGQTHPSNNDNPIASEANAGKPDDSEAFTSPGISLASPEAAKMDTDRDIPSSVVSGPMITEGIDSLIDKSSVLEMAAESASGRRKASSNEASIQEEILPHKPVIKDDTPAPVAAQAETQAAVTAEKKPDPVKKASEPVMDTDSKKNILLAQKQAPLKTFSDTADSGNTTETENLADERNQDISNSEEPGTIPEKYNLDNEYEAVDRIALFEIRSYENIDKQSLILRTGYSDYYLLVLRRPRFEVSYGKTIFDYQGSTIIAGHDRIIMNYPGNHYYIIDKIYKLKGREQVTEIKKLLSED